MFQFRVICGLLTASIKSHFVGLQVCSECVYLESIDNFNQISMVTSLRMEETDTYAFSVMH